MQCQQRMLGVPERLNSKAWNDSRIPAPKVGEGYESTKPVECPGLESQRELGGSDATSPRTASFFHPDLQ